MASEFFKIGGLTAQYDLPLGGNLYSIGFDKTTSAADGGNRCCGPAFPYDNFAGLYYGQQKQVVTSLLLRAQLYPWRNINVIASGYFNRYDTHVADKPLN